MALPSVFQALLERLGLDPGREGEVFECGPAENGCHLYGEWFYFVREIVSLSAGVLLGGLSPSKTDTQVGGICNRQRPDGRT